MDHVSREGVYQGLGVAISLAVVWVSWRWGQQRRVKAEEEALFAAKYGCQPPTPWNAKWPLSLDYLASAFTYANKKQILSWFVKVMEELPTTFEQNLLGGRGVNTIDPRNIEAILSTNFNDYCLGLREPTFRPLLGSGIFTQDGKAWKDSRHLLRPQLATTRPQNFERIQKCVQDLIDAVPKDGIIDLQPLCFRLTFDTTMFLLFGESVSDADWGQVAGQESDFAKAFNTAQEYLSYRGRLGPFYWVMNGKEFRESCRLCHQFVDEAVGRALKASSDRDHDDGKDDAFSSKNTDCFVESLVRQTTDPQVIRDQCLNVLLAGRDTTGCALQWSFRLLSQHPKVLERLRSEIQDVCGIGADAAPPSREDLKDNQKSRLPYLHLVIREVLRLYPSVPVNSREAARLTVLPVGGGPDGESPVFVRPGEGVGYCPYVMHRRKDIYGQDAEEFRPERWEGDALKDVGWGYLPFNGGPRICLGQEFAWLLISYTIARVVQVFPKIGLPPGDVAPAVGQEKQNLTLVVSSAEGCVVSLGS